MTSIAVDLDGVVSNTMPYVNGFIYQTTKQIPDEQMPLRDRVMYYCRFFRHGNYMDVQPVEGAPDALRWIQKGNKLYIVTNRAPKCYIETKRWIDRYCPGIFEEIYMNDMMGDNSKKRLLQRIGAEVLIDDEQQHITEAEAQGIYAIHFQTWAKILMRL